ncbi:sensor domain-containing protein [Natronococcus jeotgali]|uniref:Sensor protein n=1 Tax=Natronococcus jeotgali DSM 18795 TaxID=1227498 RepID=L9X2N8_9EURY|nr:sensor domain-containing protein [Natronococcus jeotgali]ELY55741.1 sensor protein [Natronococcus jeotgali DSM 18795]
MPPNQPDAAGDGGALPTDALRTGSDRPFYAAPIDPWTYRSLAYVLLAFPLGIAYLVSITVGASMTLGLSLTLLGPVALVATLLSIVALARLDGALTRGLLAVDVAPSIPPTDRGLAAFLKRLVFGRETWFGAAYLGWKILLGICGFVVLVVGVSLATSLLVAPAVYGADLVVYAVIADPVVIGTLPRALGAAVAGLLALVATLYLANVLGRLSALVAAVLLDSRTKSRTTA